MQNLRSSDKTQFKIAGAGPCGLATAICLNQAGKQVQVHEAKDRVASRWKEGLQILENFSEKENVLEEVRKKGIETDFYAKPITDVTLWDGKKKKASFKSKEALGYYVKRGCDKGDLDRTLLDQAVGRGVSVLFNSRLQPSEADVNSTGPRRIDGMGKEVTFKTNLSDRMTVILDPKLAPGGYAYLFVNEGEATMGMAILQHYKRVDELFDKTAQRFKEIEKVSIEDGDEAYLYANFFMKQTLEKQGRLYCGEAGGFQDYLFGFGIRYAIQSGSLAAESLLMGKSYDELWKERLEKKQKISLWNRFMYEKFQNWLPSIFISLAMKSSDFRDYMRSWYEARTLKLITSDWIQHGWKKKRKIELSSEIFEPAGTIKH